MEEVGQTASIDPTFVLMVIMAIAIVGAILLLRRRRNEHVDIQNPEQQRRSISPGTDPEVAALISEGQTVAAIKLVRERTGLGLKEAKDHVEALMSGRPASPPPRQKASESTDLDAEVRGLLSEGLVIEAIKLVRERTGMGLKEAKEHVDRLR